MVYIGNKLKYNVDKTIINSHGELLANMWAQSRMKNKPMERYRLNQKLRKKGINQGIINYY